MRYSMLQLFLARRLGSDDLFATFDPETSRDEHLKRVFTVETSFLHYKRGTSRSAALTTSISWG
jgi:hypothetical protein